MNSATAAVAWLPFVFVPGMLCYQKLQKQYEIAVCTVCLYGAPWRNSGFVNAPRKT